MCDVKVKDKVPSKELRERLGFSLLEFNIPFQHKYGCIKDERETRNRWYNLGTTAKQAAMVWACVAKRRRWLGKEMYWV